MGLPLEQARRLLLARAWRDVAGEIVARRAPALGVRRGVLEILVPDGSWGRVLPEIIPRLAGRLAAQHAELRVTRYRLVLEGSAARFPAQPVGVGRPAGEVAADPAGSRRTAAASRGRGRTARPLGPASGPEVR